METTGHTHTSYLRVELLVESCSLLLPLNYVQHLPESGQPTILTM